MSELAVDEVKQEVTPYEKAFAELSQKLVAYIASKPQTENQDALGAGSDVQNAFTQIKLLLAEAAFNDRSGKTEDSINIEVVKQFFEEIYAAMNLAIFVANQPRRIGKIALPSIDGLGLSLNKVSPMPDAYVWWDTQFMTAYGLWVVEKNQGTSTEDTFKSFVLDQMLEKPWRMFNVSLGVPEGLAPGLPMPVKTASS